MHTRTSEAGIVFEVRPPRIREPRPCGCPPWGQVTVTDANPNGHLVGCAKWGEGAVR